MALRGHGERRWAVPRLTIAAGTARKYRVVVKDLSEPYAMPVELIDRFDDEYSFVGNDGPVLFFMTDQDAPRRRLIAIDLGKPERTNWRELVAQADETLMEAEFVGNLFVVTYLKDVLPLVKIYTADGRFVRNVDFHGIGSVGGFHGKRTDTETFYSFASFATPPSIYRYDLITGESRLLRRAK